MVQWLGLSALTIAWPRKKEQENGKQYSPLCSPWLRERGGRIGTGQHVNTRFCHCCSGPGVGWWFVHHPGIAYSPVSIESSFLETA